MQHSEYAQAVLSAHGSVLPGEDRRGVGDIVRPPRLALPATIYIEKNATQMAAISWRLTPTLPAKNSQCEPLLITSGETSALVRDM